MRTFPSRRGGTSYRQEQGSVMILVTVALLALLAFAAWSTETGQAWAAKGQLQAATDASALAGAAGLYANGPQAADPAAAVAAAQAYGPPHDVINQSVQIAAADVETGSWDLQTRVFTPLPGVTDRSQVRAARVVGRRDSTLNGEVPTVLGRVLGIAGIPVTAEAIGYLGFAGVLPTGRAELPITIDCCAIAGDTPGSLCEDDYCSTITSNPPNACPLDLDGDGTPERTVSCLEFHSTPEQNACWTVFDDSSPSVSTADLTDIIENANSTPVGAEPIYIDNGTKTPVVADIHDRFHGINSFAADGPAGQDTDGDGVVDSWVVALPVVECQNPGDQCASGNPANVVGVVCFDVNQVQPTPDKIIRGEFVCPSDPRFQQCDQGGFGPGGTIDTGLDAQAPVLVR
jgi:Flp pilus assembly protein TadG